MLYLLLVILFFTVILLYFRIADRYHIVDRPNERSSHDRITIRGGGIVVLFAAAVAAIMYPDYRLPMTGIVIIGIISFLDDLYSLSTKIRIAGHVLVVTLLFVYLNLFSTWPVYGLILIYVLVIGIINAYNFMDGINGMTGAYSLIILGGLQYINLRQIYFVDADIIWLPILASLVFCYFNFRTNAKCFAGDVGSITIAFWIIMLLLSLILASDNWVYILFLAVYGVDTVLTIFHRLWLKQNIFKPHRLHFYQILSNEQRIPHLLISSAYAFIQLLLIIFVINSPKPFWVDLILISSPLIVIYIVLKPKLMKNKVSMKMSHSSREMNA